MCLGRPDQFGCEIQRPELAYSALIPLASGRSSARYSRSLPRTATGKIRKNTLRALQDEGDTTPVA